MVLLQPVTDQPAAPVATAAAGSGASMPVRSDQSPHRTKPLPGCRISLVDLIFSELKQR